MKSRLGLLGASILLVLSNSVQPVGGETLPDLSDDARALARGNAAFALDLFAKLRGQEGNLFFSPYSISTALGMTHAGARGNTASQMREVLHFPLNQDRLHPAFGNLAKVLKATTPRDGVEFHIANALWGQEGLRPVKEFVACLSTDYGAGLHTVDFRGAAEEARNEINGWVADRTRDRIPVLFEPGVLDTATLLVLTNAIYFKGKWENPFETRATREEPFTLAGGRKATVPLMHKVDHFGYVAEKHFKVLEIDYAGRWLSMLIFLPDETGGLADLEDKLTPGMIERCIGRMTHPAVHVAMPKFRMSSDFRLDQTLREMGMTDLFSRERADLSGMIHPGGAEGESGAYIEAVVHKAFVEVNEEGTEAAAATGVGAPTVSEVSKPLVFRADHPFLYLVRESHTGSILFMGRLTDPSGGQG